MARKMENLKYLNYSSIYSPSFVAESREWNCTNIDCLSIKQFLVNNDKLDNSLSIFMDKANSFSSVYRAFDN